MDDYTRKDVIAAKERILAECPGYRVYDWQDYGFKLTAFKPPHGPGFIIYQPARPQHCQSAIMPISLDAMVATLNETKPLKETT